MNITQLEIKEWGETGDLDLSDEDIRYLNCEEFNKKFDVRPIGGRSYRISTTSWIGVIKLPSGVVIRILPKLGITNFFVILNYTLNLDLQFIEQEVRYEGGFNFLELFARLFLNEVQKVIQNGLYKSYALKRENLPYIKGRILLYETLRFNRINRQLTYNEYDDLNYDNLENRLVLYGLNQLSNLPLNQEVLSGINDHIRLLLSQDITLEKMSEVDVNQSLRSLNKFNEYYGNALVLVKLIIKTLFTAALYSGESKGFGFLINMNGVFETPVTKLVSDAYQDFDVKEQEKSQNIILEKSYGLSERKIKPDIEIWKGNTIQKIVDAKYKDFKSGDSIQDSDIYQATTYSFALKSDVILIFPSSIEDWGGWYQLMNGKTLYIKTIKLDKTFPPEEYIKDLKNQIKNLVGL